MDSDSLNLDVSGIVADIVQRSNNSRQIVFVSGIFNVIHPGHLRMLNFAAECGDFLVVGVIKDGNPGVFIPENLRLDGLKAISVVSFAFLLNVSSEEFIGALKPHIVVKGKEHAALLNPEKSIIDGYGGKLLFSSGESQFSSLDMLHRELSELNHFSIRKPLEFPARHQFDVRGLAEFVHRFSSLRVIVVGDLIVDEYVTCDTLGLSQEDPTIVITPVKNDLFIGGAGIVAAHARGLGAKVNYFGIVGEDKASNFALNTLNNQGVDACLIKDESRPTTLKQRYRSRGKTLLRVSHLRQHDISTELIMNMLGKLDQVLEGADLLVFSDFNYGCLPQQLVDEIIFRCAQHGVPMAADSQSSSQVGDVSRFAGMLLLTPTEYEARLAVRDTGSGLSVLADALCRKARASHVFVTLAEEGLLVHSGDGALEQISTDLLPAFNNSPKDVAGAGDSLLMCSSMALVAGANIWQSAYLGSMAAACQVGRVGNYPLSAAELIRELML